MKALKKINVMRKWRKMYNGLPENIKSMIKMETLVRGRGGKVNPKIVVDAVKKKISPENAKILEERTASVMGDLDKAVKDGAYK